MLSRSSWIGDYNDANTFLDMFVTNDGNNRTGWSNARYDELIHAGQREHRLRKRVKNCFSRRKPFWSATKCPSSRFIFTSASIISTRTRSGHLRQHPRRASAQHAQDSSQHPENKPRMPNTDTNTNITCISCDASLSRSRCCSSSARWRFCWCTSRPAARSTSERKPASPEIERNLEGEISSRRTGLETIPALPRRSGCTAILDVSLKYRNHIGQRHHCAGAAGFDAARLAGLWLCDGRRPAARIFHRRPARTMAGLCRQFSGASWPSAFPASWSRRC